MSLNDDSDPRVSITDGESLRRVTRDNGYGSMLTRPASPHPRSPRPIASQPRPVELASGNTSRSPDDLQSTTMSPAAGWFGMSSIISLEDSEYDRMDAVSEMIDEYDPERPLVSKVSFHEAIEHNGPSNFWWSTFNLWNDILSAASIVTMPSYMMQMGVYLTFVVLIGCSYLCYSTLDVLYKLAHKYHRLNYIELVKYSLKRPGFIAASLFVFLFNWGSLVNNLQILGTILPTLLRLVGKHFLTKETMDVYLSPQWTLMYCCLLFLPLSFFKKLTSYTINSVLSIVSVWIVAGTVIFKFIQAYAVNHQPFPPHVFEPIGPAPVLAIGGICLGLVCHDLAFSVFEEYKNVNRRRWRRVIGTTMALTSVCWLIAGLPGFFMFGLNVPQNILQGFGDEDPLTTVCRVALSLNILASIPYLTFMPRISLYALTTAVFPGRVRKTPFHIIATVTVVCSSFLGAILITNLILFGELTGIPAIGLGFLLPSLMVLKMEKGVWYGPQKIVMSIVLLVGIFLGISIIVYAIIPA
jgi:amino acid permease